jgi:hypothetical protein
MPMKRTSPSDAGMQQINDLERAIIAAHDERPSLYGVDAAEIARERPAVVALAKLVADRLRSEYRERTQS